MTTGSMKVAAALCIVLVLSPGCGKHADAPTLQRVVEKLTGPSPAEHVAGAFDPDDPDKRREGIVALSEKSWGLQEPYLRGYAALLRADESPLVRSAAVRALGKAGDPNYLPDVATALDDESAEVRLDAAAALDSLPGDEAIRPLMRRAQGDDADDVRAACARALRHYPRSDVLEALRRCLADPAYVVRYEARGAMTALVGRDMGPGPADWAGAQALTDQRGDQAGEHVAGPAGGHAGVAGVVDE